MMQVFKPRYYDRFLCLAQNCPDSCCHQWTVDVDPVSAEKYRALPGALGDRLRQVLQDTPQGACMMLEQDRCPMWQEDGLCRIQAELGHEALCHTCRTFPRLRHDYGSFAELDLELSCPEAARLILEDPGELPPDHPLDSAEYDPQTMQILLDSRKTCLDFLAGCALPFPEALATLLIYAGSVQSQLDGGAPATFEPERFRALAKKFAAPGDSAALVDFFKDLEILTPQWAKRLDSPDPDPLWQSAYFALARYFVRRYWLQAISDFDLIGRVKFMVTACLLIHTLGGDLTQTAQLFSKEIENDPDNVEAILDAAYSHPALTDANLLGLILPCARM